MTKTPLQIFRTHYTDTPLPILESQVLAAMEEYANEFRSFKEERPDNMPVCRHEFVTCDANGKITDTVSPSRDYRAICQKCGYRP